MPQESRSWIILECKRRLVHFPLIYPVDRSPVAQRLPGGSVQVCRSAFLIHLEILHQNQESYLHLVSRVIPKGHTPIPPPQTRNLLLIYGIARLWFLKEAHIYQFLISCRANSSLGGLRDTFPDLHTLAPLKQRKVRNIEQDS